MSHRKHIRLTGYDYTSPNYYFVTVCTDYRREIFTTRVSNKYGELFSNEVVAGPWPANNVKNTNIIEDKVNLIEDKFPAEIDFYCIMHDHLHLIIFLQVRQGRATTLSTIVNAFKGWCTRELGFRVFQPNFYEHIIRSEMSLDRIRRYILNNPLAEYRAIPWKSIDPVI